MNYITINDVKEGNRKFTAVCKSRQIVVGPLAGNGAQSRYASKRSSFTATSIYVSIN